MFRVACGVAPAMASTCGRLELQHAQANLAAWLVGDGGSVACGAGRSATASNGAASSGARLLRRLMRRPACARMALRGIGRDQRDQADIGAAADALQHHVADTDRRLDAALLQRVVARLVEAGLGEIAKAEQRTRGVAGADEQAVARKRGDRRIDAFDQPLQPFDQRHGAADGVWRRRSECRGCRRRNRAARSRRSRACRAAAPKPRSRSSRTAPFAGRRPASCATCRRCGSAGPNIFSRERRAVGRAEQRAPTGLAHRIRVPSVDHSHAGRALVACTASRGSPSASQLEFRIVHRDDMTALVGRLLDDGCQVSAAKR